MTMICQYNQTLSSTKFVVLIRVAVGDSASWYDRVGTAWEEVDLCREVVCLVTKRESVPRLPIWFETQLDPRGSGI